MTVAGTWVGDGTVFVSGREHDGVDGYWVVTPLAVGDAGDPALPVVRGWAAAPDEAPAPPAGTAELVAWLQPTEGTGETDDDPDDDVLPQVRTADLIQHVDQDLYGAYAVAQESEPGLAPATLEQLPSVGRFTAVRNLLYAVEWWFFGAFAAVHLVALRDRVRGPGTGGARRRGRPGTFGAVISLFNAYRVLALVVGVLLAFCTVALRPEVRPRPRAPTSSSSGRTPASCGSSTAGCSWCTSWSRSCSRAGRDWTIGFTLLTLIAGLVPLLIFWVEHQVNLKVRAENPELVGSAPA